MIDRPSAGAPPRSPPGTPPHSPKRRACPICARPPDPKLHPFCSKRCADVDLHRWLAESYRVPAVENEDEADDALRDEDGTPDASR